MIMWCSTVGVIVTLTLSLLTAPLAAQAQPAKVPRIGVLGLIPRPERVLVPFREGLRERGYVEGQNILVEYRWVAAGQADRLNDLAVELVRLQVDLIVAVSTPASQAAQRATTAIPIVMLAGDPVGTGLVASLARPGGNITGISAMTADIGGKSLDLLRELLPTVTHVAALVHATDPFARLFLEHIQSAAQGVSVRIQPVVVRGAEEFDSAFAAMVTERAGAVIVQPSLATQHAADLAVQHHLPAISPSMGSAEAGGLMSYLSNTADNFLSGIPRYVAKILKGAKPADLPVEQAMKFELVINLKTAKALGLTIPPTLLFQADEVIQ
jgi:putative tryptophan/tyrosine transport system substrate-binding protein